MPRTVMTPIQPSAFLATGLPAFADRRHNTLRCVPPRLLQPKASTSAMVLHSGYGAMSGWVDRPIVRPPDLARHLTTVTRTPVVSLSVAASGGVEPLNVPFRARAEEALVGRVLTCLPLLALAFSDQASRLIPLG